MANNFAAKLKTAFRTFYHVLADYSATWTPLTDAISESAPTYKESDVYGLTTYAAQVDAPTAKDLLASGSTTNVAAFEEVVKVTRKDVNDSPEILARVAADLATLGAWTLTKAFWDVVKALDVTTHPENGGSTYTAQGGGTVYFADAFTIDPPNVAAYDQANLFNDALDDIALANDIAAYAEYRDKSGNPAAVPGQKPWLIVPPMLTATAKNLIGRAGEVFDGSGLQLGGFSDSINGIVTMPGTVTDDNDWMTWWKRPIVGENGQVLNVGPVVPWLRVAPTVEFRKAVSSNHWYVIAYMEYAIHMRTFEGDVHLHKVA